MNRVLVPELAAAPRPPRGTTPFVLSGESMGTTWNVQAFAPSAYSIDALLRAIEWALASVVSEMSTWEAGSDISRFNALEPGAWATIPGGFRTVLACALEVADRTDGAFNPCIGALVDLWGFGARAPAHEIPPNDHIEAALRAADRSALAFGAERGRLRQPGGLRLDFSGIAKGFAVDEVARVLTRVGLNSYLVEIGGEVRGAGIKPDGLPWWVEIERPPGCPSMPIIVALHGISIATSGDYRRNAILDGKRIAHTIDPRTGRPLENDVASVTVLHPSCMHADALATAFLVTGAAIGKAFADAEGVAAIWITRTPEGFSETHSAAFTRMLGE